MYSKITALLAKDETLIPIDLEDFPHGDLTNVRKDEQYDIEFYSVPDGIKVVAYDETTKQPVLADVKYWSIHRGKEVEIVNLSNGDQIYSDNDPRAVYGIGDDCEGMVPKRYTPSEAMTHKVLVPIATEMPRATGTELRYDFMTNTLSKDGPVAVDYEFGQFIGMMAGDGWVDNHCSIPWLSDNEWFNANFGLSYLRSVFGPNVGMTSREFKKSELKGRYGDTTKHNYTGIENVTVFCESLKSLIGGNRNDTTSGSGNKRLPLWFRSAGKECLKGFINGLVATDGSVSVSNAKGKPQLLVSFCSTSIRLAREFRECCRLLGIKAGLTHSKKTTAGNEAWIVGVSTIDAKRIGLLDNCCHTRKRDTFTQTDVSSDTTNIRNDIVPLPKSVSNMLFNHVKAVKCQESYRKIFKGTDAEWNDRKLKHSIYINLYNSAKRGFMTRALVWEIQDAYGEKLQNEYLWDDLLSVARSSIGWASVQSVEKTGSIQQGYDLTVPGYETFMNTDGVILSNTVNIHVPVSEKAVKQAKEKMMPSKNLIQTTDLRSTRHSLGKEMIFGVYKMTEAPSTKPPVRFASMEDAKKAYREGKIGINDPIIFE